MANKSKGVFLEIDSSITEKNLSFATDPKEDEFNKMFNVPQTEQCPSKLVTPFPGFCIKTKQVGADGSKFFVNICHTDAIPSPKDITEKELAEILESDEPSSFRVPMSIGDVRNERDNKGEEANVCDIAVHPAFFKKVGTSSLFKSFLITLVFEGLQEKHGIICTDEKIILKNKKAFGTLQVHRIRQKEVEQKMNKPILIEEIKSEGAVKPMIEELNNNPVEAVPPEYRLFRRRNKPNSLIGEFKFPDIISGKELLLDVGEDRILIDSSNKKYFLDIFIPHIIRQASSSSTFNKATKILTITMPLVGG